MDSMDSIFSVFIFFTFHNILKNRLQSVGRQRDIQLCCSYRYIVCIFYLLQIPNIWFSFHNNLGIVKSNTIKDKISYNTLKQKKCLQPNTLF